MARPLEPLGDRHQVRAHPPDGGELECADDEVHVRCGVLARARVHARGQSAIARDAGYFEVVHALPTSCPEMWVPQAEPRTRKVPPLLLE